MKAKVVQHVPSINLSLQHLLQIMSAVTVQGLIFFAPAAFLFEVCPLIFGKLFPIFIPRILLGVIAIYHMVYFVAKFALGVGGGVPSN